MPAAPGVHRAAEVDLLAVQQDLALVRDQRPGQRLDQAGLAGAVVADHREDLAGIELEVAAVDGGHPAVPLDQALRLQDRRARSAAVPRADSSVAVMPSPSGSTGRCATATQTSRPIAKPCQTHLDAGELQPVAEHADDQRADQRAEHAAAAAEQAGAADHDGGDGVEVVVAADVRAGRREPADEDPGADRVDQRRPPCRPTAAPGRSGCRPAGPPPRRRRWRRRACPRPCCPARSRTPRTAAA